MSTLFSEILKFPPRTCLQPESRDRERDLLTYLIYLTRTHCLCGTLLRQTRPKARQVAARRAIERLEAVFSGSSRNSDGFCVGVPPPLGVSRSPVCRDSRRIPIVDHLIPDLFASPIGHDCLAPILIVARDLLSSSPHGPVMEMDVTPFTLASQSSISLHATWVTSRDRVLPSRANVKAHSLTRIRQRSVLGALAEGLCAPCQPVLMDGGRLGR